MFSKVALARGFGGCRSNGATSPRTRPTAPPWLGQKRMASTAYSSIRSKAVTNFYMGGYSFHADVASGRKRMPCATTPAPTEEGRPAPKSSRGQTPGRPGPLVGGQAPVCALSPTGEMCSACLRQGAAPRNTPGLHLGRGGFG